MVLIDLNLGPDQDAFASITSIRENHPDIKVVVVSASLDWELAAAARASGASGYLPKDLSVADMVAAIRELGSPGNGRPAVSDVLGRLGRDRTARRVGAHLLTAREQQVLAELRRGRTNKEIAGRLNVSITTVNKHVQHVLKKLKVSSRTQAVAMVDAAVSGRSYLFRDPVPGGHG